MTVPAQSIVAGCLQTTFRRELKHFLANRILERLWAKDASLWSGEEFEPSHIQASLEFLDLPDKLDSLLFGVLGAESIAQAEGLFDRVLVAFANLHLTARAIVALSPPLTRPRIFVLDNTNPISTRAVENEIDLPHTVFLFDNKSSFGLEHHSLFLYFWHRLELAGIQEPRLHFASHTVSSSYLASVTKDYKFRFKLKEPAGIPSVFGSIRYFAGHLAAFACVPTNEVLTCAKESRASCSRGADQGENPALQLAVFIASAANARVPFLYFLAPPLLGPYAALICQLVGGSLCREGQRPVPISLSAPCSTESFEDSGAFVILTRGEEVDPTLQAQISRIEEKAIPFIHIRLSQPLDLLAEIFKWQVATALAGARLARDPFDWEGVRLPQTLAAELLNNLKPGNNTLLRRPRVQESGIQLFAEGRTRHEISLLNLVESLSSFLELRQPESLLTLFVFLHRSPETQEQIFKIREQLVRTLGIPVLVAYGPRAVDTYGYLFRRGSPSRLNIIMTAENPVDVPIPGASYTFGQMYHALALGQFEALASDDRFAIRLHLEGDLAQALERLHRILVQAGQRVRI